MNTDPSWELSKCNAEKVCLGLEDGNACFPRVAAATTVDVAADAVVVADNKEVIVGDGSTYRGEQTRTRLGKLCQEWAAQYPHTHYITPELKPNRGLAKNYCRNPDGNTRIWCYTTDPPEQKGQDGW